jgi:hypothetical protein
MTARNSNATSITTAAALADAAPGRFRGLIIRKQGVTRGRGAAKQRYGDDLVHVIIFGGFKYDRLVARSREMLQAMNPADIVAEFATKGITDGKGGPIRLADVCKAVADLDVSFEKTLAGTNSSTTEHVYEQLVVDGEAVRGGKVYRCVASDPNHACKCRDCTGDAKAPVDGQVNIAGLKIGETIIDASANGPIPSSKSRADVVAKRVIRSRLPVGRYVSYRLEAGGDWILRVGPDAATAATKDGVTCDPKKVKAAVALMAG